MSEPKDGGPAFPLMIPSRTPGMSLRDWFAGKAMEGLFAANNGADFMGGNYPAYAECAYIAADAMLAEREKGKP